MEFDPCTDFQTSLTHSPEDLLFCGRFARLRIKAGVLHLRGKLDVLSYPTIGVVGSRECSGPGLVFASALAEDAARLGLCVVSGGARGIDAAAHRGALRVGGRTAIVLGTPIDAPSPQTTRQLCDSVVAQGGLLVSEYAGGERVHRRNFLERNRIVAALSDVLVVVDAREQSGALATARQARKLGRQVWVTPGAPWDEHSDGSNALLREGARPILSRADFALAIEERFGMRPPAKEPDPLTDPLRSPRSIDEWRVCTGLDIARAYRVMFELVKAGKVKRLPDGRYIRG